MKSIPQSKRGRYHAGVNLPQRIRITEVGPRDGLQNEGCILTVPQKIALIDALTRAGLPEIEVTSFVNPRRVPQLGDAEDVLAGITRHPDTIYSALVPNMPGMERASRCEIDKIAVFTAASESFNRHNIGATIAESIARFQPVVKAAREENRSIRGYISCVVSCPYEGPIAPAQVRDIASMLLDLGVDEIDLGETIGMAVPGDIERLYAGLSDLLAPEQTILHLHDTRGTALACAMRAMELGVWRFDTSCAGLGGCPFAPGAMGNLATEDLVYLCNREGCETGVNLPSLFEAGRQMTAALGRDLPGRAFTADGAAS